jgi:hypothetical protein
MILPASLLMLVQPHMGFIAAEAIAVAFATVAVVTQVIEVL